MASYNPPTQNLPIFDSSVFTDTTTTSSGTTLSPLTPSPAGTYQSVQNVSIDQYGRTTAVETAVSGTYLANGQHQAIDPLPQIPMLTGGWNNIIQTSIITDNWLFTTYADHNTLSIKVGGISSYTRYDYFMVRLTWSAFWSGNQGSSPFPFQIVDSGSWNVCIFPSNLVNLTTTSGGAITAPTANGAVGFFDLDTNQYLINWGETGGTYDPNMGLGITYPTPQSIYAPTGRALWCINPTNQSGVANFRHTLYPTQVNVDNTSIITFQFKNPIVYSNMPQQYSSSLTAELIAGGRWTDTISFIA